MHRYKKRWSRRKIRGNYSGPIVYKDGFLSNQVRSVLTFVDAQTASDTLGTLDVGYITFNMNDPFDCIHTTTTAIGGEEDIGGRAEGYNLLDGLWTRIRCYKSTLSVTLYPHMAGNAYNDSVITDGVTLPVQGGRDLLAAWGFMCLYIHDMDDPGPTIPPTYQELSANPHVRQMRVFRIDTQKPVQVKLTWTEKQVPEFNEFFKLNRVAVNSSPTVHQRVSVVMGTMDGTNDFYFNMLSKVRYHVQWSDPADNLDGDGQDG